MQINPILLHIFAFSAESEQGTADWSTGYNSCAGCSDVNSPQVCCSHLR